MSSSGREYWQLSRLRRDTVERLRQLGKRLDRARDRGQLAVDPGEQGWSVDQLVAFLLDQDDNHLERARKASHKRVMKRQAKASEPEGGAA